MTDASGVKGVPLVPTSTEPFVFLAGRPAAERATDARRLRLAGFLLFKLAIHDRFRGVGHNGTFLTRLIGLLAVAFA